MNNNNQAIYISILALVVSVACAAGCWVSRGHVANAPVSATPASVSAEDVRNVLMNNPEIIYEAQRVAEQKRFEEQERETQKRISENLDEIINYKDAAVIGNPEGKVTLVEFFDFSCGYCHRLHPVLKKLVAKNPDLRLVLREITFVNPEVSTYAAKAALAAKNQGKYAELWAAMMESEEALSAETIDALAASNGIDVAQMKADMESAQIEKIINDTADLASKIQIGGVPTMILDGKVLRAYDEASIQKALDEAKK